jgi:hypothetical protein
MILNADAPIDAALLARAIAFGKTLPKLDPGQYLNHLTFHWQVGTYEQTSEDYNLECFLAGDEWAFQITQDPRHNAVQCGPDAPYAAHTWERNSHNLGCAVAAMWNATPSDFGPDPVQEHELEAFLAMCAAACVAYNLDPTDSDQCKTHAEWAALDLYFPGDGDPDARWDFARLQPSGATVTVEEATATAQAMRARCAAWKRAMEAS